MRRGERFSGMPGIVADDVAVSVSAGPLRDRSHETLSSADVAVNRLYRVLLRCARQVQRGDAPVGLDAKVDLSAVIGAHGAVSAQQPWQQLVPNHVSTSAQAHAA